jgi:hypothetical protein
MSCSIFLLVVWAMRHMRQRSSIRMLRNTASEPILIPEGGLSAEKIFRCSQMRAAIKLSPPLTIARFGVDTNV